MFTLANYCDMLTFVAFQIVHSGNIHAELFLLLFCMHSVVVSKGQGNEPEAYWGCGTKLHIFVEQMSLDTW